MSGKFVSCLLGSLLLSLVGCLNATAAPPRYAWQPQQKFVYEVEIDAELPDNTERFRGQISYEVQSTDDPLVVTFEGGLTKRVERKPGTSARRGGSPFGPGFFAPPPIGGPFGRRANSFSGLTRTTNKITLTDRGEILAVDGGSQLPYLIGNLSLLVFEPLPEDERPSWTVDGGVLLTEKSRGRGRSPFDPFGGDPFFAGRSGNEPEKTLTGSRSKSFVLERESPALVSYKQTYQLQLPQKQFQLEIDGSGTWTFNKQLGIAESLDMQRKLTIQEGNVSVVIPVSIRYQRLAGEQLAKLEQERLAAEEMRRAEAARMAAEAKAKADAAIEGDERRQILQALAASDASQQEDALKMLASKTPRDDPELAAAIRPLAANARPSLRTVAQKALAAFAPDYRNVYDLNASYRGPRPVEQLGFWIRHDTPLPPGLIVAANHFGQPEDRYYPAEVVATISNGLVRVKYTGRGSFTEERLREDMYLPPADVEQPNLNERQRAELAAYREQVQKELGDTPEEIAANTDLNRAYRDNKQPLPKTGSPLPPGVTLPKYLVVAAQKEDGQWYQAHVSEELSDGRVAVRFSGERWDAKLPRARLRLPPPEVRSPNLPPVVPVGTRSAVRTWTDDTGTFRMEARLISQQSDSVKLLRTSDGVELTVPRARLSEADLRYLDSLAPAVTNPFE